MASGDRFYLLELRHRSALWGDIGNLLKIEGVVIGGSGAQAVLMLPGNSLFEGKCAPPVLNLSPEEWSEWLRISDDPQVLVGGSLEKAFHRKLRYDISGAVQQKIWVADGCLCMYCGKPMGKVQLTIDHFWPLEMGGANSESNYLSACKNCNKDKGSMDPKVWIERRGLFNYKAYVDYLAVRKLP